MTLNKAKATMTTKKATIADYNKIFKHASSLAQQGKSKEFFAYLKRVKRQYNDPALNYYLGPLGSTLLRNLKSN